MRAHDPELEVGRAVPGGTIGPARVMYRDLHDSYDSICERRVSERIRTPGGRPQGRETRGREIHLVRPLRSAQGVCYTTAAREPHHGRHQPRWTPARVWR
jgi:hypothetical protein